MKPGCDRGGFRNTLASLAVVVPAAMLLMAGPVFAQTPSPEAVAESQPAPKSQPQEQVNVKMEEVEIRGELERPGVFYIIPRREVQMDLGTRYKDYSREIMEPILPEVFARWARTGAGQ